MASPSATTMPMVDPIHTPTQSWSAARVIVASIVLVAELGKQERGEDHEERGRGGLLGAASPPRR